MSLAEQIDGAGAGGEEGGGASAEEEEPAFETIWDSPCIEKYKNDQGKPTWRCLHCGFVKAYYNASKALAHVLCISGQHVKLCLPSKISADYKRKYRALQMKQREITSERRLANESMEIAIGTQQSDLTNAIASSKRNKNKRGAATLSSQGSRGPPSSAKIGRAHV